jgi:glycosyltransferase involved in cell wall biosynthesis
MRIGVVSTYPPIECGIATYTRYLTDEFIALGNELYIVSQFGGKGEKVYPVFDSESPDLAKRAFQTMAKFNPDIVHIQHEFGLFGKPEGISCIPLVYRFKLAGIPVVITLHTVYEEIPKEKRIVLEALIRVADRVIVHEEYQKEAILREIGQFDNIRVIPHGARELEPVPEAKKKIGLGEDVKVVLLCGYFRRTKGMDRVIRIFPQVAERVKNAVLVIASRLRQDEFKDYKDELLGMAERSPASKKILVVGGQIPQETFDTIMSAADVIPLPYRKGAQSGIFAHCLAFGAPVVVSPDVRSLREAVTKIKCGFVAASDEESVECIVKILTDDDLRSELSKNAREYVRKNIVWKRVAERTAELYRELIKTPSRFKYLQ